MRGALLTKSGGSRKWCSKSSSNTEKHRASWWIGCNKLPCSQWNWMMHLRSTVEETGNFLRSVSETVGIMIVINAVRALLVCQHVIHVRQYTKTMHIKRATPDSQTPDQVNIAEFGTLQPQSLTCNCAWQVICGFYYRAPGKKHSNAIFPSHVSDFWTVIMLQYYHIKLKEQQNSRTGRLSSSVSMIRLLVRWCGSVGLPLISGSISIMLSALYSQAISCVYYIFFIYLIFYIINFICFVQW